jgi:hypothetical protein
MLAPGNADIYPDVLQDKSPEIATGAPDNRFNLWMEHPPSVQYKLPPGAVHMSLRRAPLPTDNTPFELIKVRPMLAPGSADIYPDVLQDKSPAKPALETVNVALSFNKAWDTYPPS